MTLTAHRSIIPADWRRNRMVGTRGPERTELSIPKDYNVYYVRGPLKEKFLKYFDDKDRCFPLLGSAARYNGNGHIFWIEFGDLKRSRDELIAAGYTQVSKVDPRAKLDAENTLYRDSIGLKFYWFFSVEGAIKSVRDYILPAEMGKEKGQMTTAQSWISELLNFYCSGNFAKIPPEEFIEVEKFTLAVLEKMGIIDPHKLVNQLKEKGFLWLQKAGSGKDAIGRENYIVTKESLEAALKRMKEREKAIRGPIVRKYQFILAALESTRCTDRRILEVVLEELCTMSEIVVFRHPGVIYQDGTVGPTVDKLDDLIDRLKLPLLDPYHSRGVYASAGLQAIRNGLKDRGKVTERDLERLKHVRDWIEWDLNKGNLYYSASTNGNKQRFDFQV